MAIKNHVYKDAPEFNEEKADWTKVIKLKDGEGITITLLRPLNQGYQEKDGTYPEFQYLFRDSWFPSGDKPEKLKGNGIKLPILDFETPGHEKFSPINYLADHPEMFKTPSGKDLKVSGIKRDFMLVVLATDVYQVKDKNALTTTAFDFSAKTLKILNPTKTTYKKILDAYELYEAENTTPPLGVPIQIKRTGSKMNDTDYSVTIRADKPLVVPDPYAVSLDIDLMRYIPFQTFKGQLDFLSGLGYNLPLANPDGEDESVPEEEEE